VHPPLLHLTVRQDYITHHIYPSYMNDDVHIINMLKGMTEVSFVVKASWNRRVFHQQTQLRSKVTVLLLLLAFAQCYQMVDLEKDTRRWWFSPRS